MHPVGKPDQQRTPPASIFSSCPPESHRACHLLPYNLFPGGSRTSSQGLRLSWSWGGLYEGYFDDAFGNCYYYLLTDRLAFGSKHSGSYEFYVGQRSAKNLGSWTPVRFQKIALHRFFNSDRRVPALFFLLATSILTFFLRLNSRLSLLVVVV